MKLFATIQNQDLLALPVWTAKDLGAERRTLRVQLRPALDAFRPRPRTPGATVVVWGEASQARREEMQQFAQDFAPVFRSAFDVGRSSSVGGQFLSQLMALAANPNQNPAPASAPSVWYNSLDPWARDPKFWK